MLPEDIQESGVITIVTDTSFGPPWNFNPEENPDAFEGIDPDLARAFAQYLGVELEFVSTAFDGIIPALIAERYDIAMVGMFTNAERQQQIDQIAYVEDANTIVVAEGNPEGITGLDDLCGKPVAVVQGTFQSQIIEDHQPTCDEPMDIKTFPAQTDSFLQVRTGRSVATVEGYAGSFYNQTVGAPGVEGLQPLADVRLRPTQLGIGMAKEKSQLRDAIVEALTLMIEDGTYEEILSQWDISANALDEIVVNPHLD